MSMKGINLLTEEQEKQLKIELEALWTAKNTRGDYIYDGKEIAKALGFGGERDLGGGRVNPYADLDPERVYYYRHKFELEKRSDKVNYPHRYKYGKQDAILDLDVLIKRLEKIGEQTFHRRRMTAGCALGFWGGFRNTENRLLTVNDFEFDETPNGQEILRVDVFRLKKGDIPRFQATFPVELRLDWVFVDKIIKWIENYEGDQRPWDVSRWTWWNWHKKVFGEKFYPHWLRENVITLFCSNPNVSIAEIHKWTGLHLVTINEYISKSRRFSITATEKMHEYRVEKQHSPRRVT
ncbi:MAG: hypothetical protein ACTSPB_09070 [Candidatus Thorarchaeota archaeon]